MHSCNLLLDIVRYYILGGGDKQYFGRHVCSRVHGAGGTSPVIQCVTVRETGRTARAVRGGAEESEEGEGNGLHNISL